MPGEIVFIPNPLVGEQWELAPETQTMIDGVGEQVAATAQALAPVETGFLRDSIVVQPGEEAGASVVIIATAPYAAFNEWGTAKMDPHPYLRPALDTLAGT